ncbi:transmembrane protein 186 [Pseudophryne corroboree]|uniref:transmembrane protein 186 n=1 Tax=Pseudophryne corroboree TaxID=495146 RepID=UPI003082065D
MIMTQLFIKSVLFRPIYPWLSVCMWKSQEVYRPTYNACDVANLLFANKNPQIQSKHRFCSSAPSNTMPGDNRNFTLIYKFPGIRYCRAVSRLKLLQTTLTVLLLPPIYYYYLQGQLSQFSVIYVTGTAVFAGFMLYSLSYYLRRVIGMIYVDDDLSTLKVSHLTFWGRRKNIFVPLEDVKKLSETGDGRREVLLKFGRYSSSDILYFTVRLGQILDREKFTVVFGELK